MPRAGIMLLWLAGTLLACAAEAPRAAADLGRYQVILDRHPFGKPLSPEEQAARAAANEQIARDLRISSIVEMETGVRVGVVNTKQNNRCYLLAVGESEDGIEVVSANPQTEEVLLRTGGQQVLLKLQGATAAGVAGRVAAPSAAALATAAPAGVSYAERRRLRTQAQTPPEIPKPMYTGEQLEQHLREYQMEIIRSKSLPPLPIPLTPEQDAQLVKEGVLPPQ